MKFLHATRSLTLGFALTAFCSFSSLAFASVQTNLKSLEPLDEHNRITAEVVNRLSQQHYQRTQVRMDNNLSSIVYDRYLKELDGNRSYFLQSDIDEFEAFRYRLDDAFRARRVDPGFVIFNRYQQRVAERLEFLSASIENGIKHLDFTVNESMQLDRENHAWPQSKKELDKLWTRRLKNC